MDEEIFGEGWKHLSKGKILPKQKTTYIHQYELPWECGMCAHPYIDQDEVALAYDTRVNRPLRYCYILAPESVLHMPVDYYLSVHNSGKYICNTTTDINHMIYLFF
jgi:hypothetical protein